MKLKYIYTNEGLVMSAPILIVYLFFTSFFNATSANSHCYRFCRANAHEIILILTSCLKIRHGRTFFLRIAVDWMLIQLIESRADLNPQAKQYNEDTNPAIYLTATSQFIGKRVQTD